ncbi:MAG TPA: hypothetical protein VH186_03640 [Chloroflexia bacterium]|nr:hypothetical protein [Chloroflexia bacterium]
MSTIKVFFTDQEKQNLLPGRYYIGVQVKIPIVIVTGDNEDMPTIPPSLDPQNTPYHSHPNVASSETRFVIFDITDHPYAPVEHTVAAANLFLADHYPELDRALRDHLREVDDPEL